MPTERYAQIPDTLAPCLRSSSPLEPGCSARRVWQMPIVKASYSVARAYPAPQREAASKPADQHDLTLSLFSVLLSCGYPRQVPPIFQLEALYTCQYSEVQCAPLPKSR